MSPKQSGNTPKTKRHKLIMEVFRRHGKLNKEQVDHYLSSYMESDRDYKRSLYRDLEELVNTGLLSSNPLHARYARNSKL